MPVSERMSNNMLLNLCVACCSLPYYFTTAGVSSRDTAQYLHGDAYTQTASHTQVSDIGMHGYLLSAVPGKQDSMHS